MKAKLKTKSETRGGPAQTPTDRKIPASTNVGAGSQPKNQYAKDTMDRARHEIIALRRSNEVLSAKVDTLEIFAVALGMRNGNRELEADVAWELQNAINSLE